MSMRLKVASAPYANGTSRRMFQSWSTGTSATSDARRSRATKSHSGTSVRSRTAASVGSRPVVAVSAARRSPRASVRLGRR